MTDPRAAWNGREEHAPPRRLAAPPAERGRPVRGDAMLEMFELDVAALEASCRA